MTIVKSAFAVRIGDETELCFSKTCLQLLGQLKSIERYCVLTLRVTGQLRGGHLRHSGSTLYIRLGKPCQWAIAWKKGMVGGKLSNLKGIRRIGPVMFPRWTEINAWQTLSASLNSHQLRSFFISNRSSIHESKVFPVAALDWKKI